jgi:hypothetical protein
MIAGLALNRGYAAPWAELSFAVNSSARLIFGAVMLGLVPFFFIVLAIMPSMPVIASTADHNLALVTHARREARRALPNSCCRPSVRDWSDH